MIVTPNPVSIVRAISTGLTHLQAINRPVLHAEAMRFLGVIVELRVANAAPRHIIRRYHTMSERIVADIQASLLKDSYVSLMAATQSLENDLKLLEQMKDQCGCEEDNFFAGC